ncbi:hypothetical protein [Nitrosomonas supralitoralis]|uniref:Uncharacterized protein n=1 Tax=Nitrosomonas supralitoralis TaxID=2116706 RepID=A0A2P7NSI0_9PROT|nr:hypothetical protein [Nitrosomonas supralitoralis]PSJ16433.1 hypothetical protein C7H79_13440 [Nitrosomonas supralitoralis]
MNTVFQQEQKPKSRSRILSLWKRIKNTLLIFSFLGLLSLNIATLVNDELYTAAFRALTSVLKHALGPTLTDQLISHSPTIQRENDVRIATKKLSDINKTLIREEEILTKKNKRLTKDNGVLTKNNKTLIKDKEILTEANKVLKENHAKLISGSARKSAAVQKVSQRIASRSIAGATRNIASLPGETIPILGTTLIIGVTAWDILDSCEDLKDLNKLNSAFKHPLEDQDVVCGIEIPTKEEVMAEVKENWRKAYKNAAIEINKIEERVPEIPPMMTWSEIRNATQGIFSDFF